MKKIKFFPALFILVISVSLSVGYGLYITDGTTCTVNAVTKEELNIQTINNSEVSTESPAIIDDHTRIISMLNMNYCYNDALKDEAALLKCGAASLLSFATDFESYGICVNSELVLSFIKSFYGIDISHSVAYDENAPEGYILTDPSCCGSFYHTEVSFTETDYGYEVLTCLTTYYGGSDMSNCLVKSRFIRDEESEFGFNLVFCEIL